MFWDSANSRLQRAQRAVRRELFLPRELQSRAGEDLPLPIGYAQTISQPSLVGYMTEELRVAEHSRVLEIGTGSGYQTAILAELAAEVFTIERIPELAAVARERLAGLGYRNIRFKTGDGALGWPEAAPFDAIMVTAAAPTLPLALVEQLANGGRLLVPVGTLDADDQILVLVEKAANGALRRRDLQAVRFVPLVSNAATAGRDPPGQRDG